MRSLGIAEVAILLIWLVPLLAGLVAVVVLLRISRSVERMRGALEQIAAAIEDRPRL